ncbi:MAG TPA: MOSC domain-containing protein [Levilinea sp.]|nr:MOSC domain-containing protein [Levilinea sp.]
MMKLASLQTGLPQTIRDPSGEWMSGIWKHPVTQPVYASRTGLVGDGQGDLVAHGGPDKAIYAYPQAHYPSWRAELDLPDLPYGGFGENFTLSELAENQVCIGDIFKVGSQVVVQVSQPRGPCWKLARRLGVKDMVVRVLKTGLTGWYFRVLSEGYAAGGMELVLLERPYPKMTVSLAHQGMWDEPASRSDIQRLVACPALAESWHKGLLKRLKSQEESS